MFFIVFGLVLQPIFCKTLRALLLFLVFLFLASCICFSHLFHSQSHSHTSSGENPAPTAGGRIHNELKPLGSYAGGPANASAGLVSAVSQSVQRLMELRQVRISGVTDSRFTVVLCQRFSLRCSFCMVCIFHSAMLEFLYTPFAGSLSARKNMSWLS